MSDIGPIENRQKFLKHYVLMTYVHVFLANESCGNRNIVHQQRYSSMSDLNERNNLFFRVRAFITFQCPMKAIK